MKELQRKPDVEVSVEIGDFIKYSFQDRGKTREKEARVVGMSKSSILVHNGRYPEGINILDIKLGQVIISKVTETIDGTMNG